jgi:hypothetical protein
LNGQRGRLASGKGQAEANKINPLKASKRSARR